MKDDCIFCKLANGIIPTNTIYEDDNFRVIPTGEGRDIFGLKLLTDGVKIPKAPVVWRFPLLEFTIIPIGFNLLSTDGDAL